MLVLLTSAAFAIEVSGDVQGTVTVLQGDNIKHPDPDDPTKEVSTKVTSSGGMNRLRLEGSGQNEGGNFGGWLRIEGENPSINGLAWWKPLDALKLTIGGNPDGHFGKDGVTRWMFYQTASDVGVTSAGNAWGGGYGGDAYGVFGNAFYGGDNPGFLLEVTPMDTLGINIGIPFFKGGETADIFKQTIFQVDLKLDFGNIALTYVGGLGNDIGWDFWDEMSDDSDSDGAVNPGAISGNGGKFYLYAGIPIGESVALDVGFAYTLSSKLDGLKYDAPIYGGIGFKLSSGSFGIKFRTVAGFAGKVSGFGGSIKLPMNLRFDILPFFTLSDTMRVFVSAGIGYIGELKDSGSKLADSFMDWHFNPYLEVGQEWGPKFLFGFKLWSDKSYKFSDAGVFTTNKNQIHWAVPIALEVSF